MPNEVSMLSGNLAKTDLPKSKLSGKDIDCLFLRLSAMYGRLWTELYRDTAFLRLAKQEWLSTLQVFDRETLDRALRRCRESCEVPPSLPKLYQLCKASQSPARRTTVPVNNDERSSPETAKKCLQNIKKIIGQAHHHE